MKKIVGFYQFHEMNEKTGKKENLYCIVEQEEDGNYTTRYIKDFKQASEVELVNFYRSMGYKSVEELLKDDKRFCRQLKNEVFREKLLEEYGIDTKDIKNFFQKLAKKIKQYKRRVIAGVAAVAVIAGSIFGCHLNRESKTGDAVAVVDTNTDTKKEDFNENSILMTKEEEMNEMIENTSDKKIKNYMKDFRDRIC